MPLTSYSSAGVSPRTDGYAYGAGRRKMPYASKAQARAVMANTSAKKPRHREARSYAKKALKKRNGLMPTKKMKGM